MKNHVIKNVLALNNFFSVRSIVHGGRKGVISLKVATARQDASQRVVRVSRRIGNATLTCANVAEHAQMKQVNQLQVRNVETTILV